jgi:AcrR family transcriptional regulator
MKKAKVKATKTKKKQYHHPDLRDQLVQAAVDFIKDHRAEDLSLREVARGLGVSHMAPYRHFKTKEDLLAAVIQDGFTKLSADFDRVRQDKSKVRFPKLFAEMGKAYVRFVIEHPDQARLMFSGLLCDRQRHLEAHVAGQLTFKKLLEMIELGQTEGYFSKKENPYMLGLMIWSSVHGTSMLMLEDQFRAIDSAPEVQVDLFVDYLTEKMMSGLSIR